MKNTKFSAEVPIKAIGSFNTLLDMAKSGQDMKGTGFYEMVDSMAKSLHKAWKK